MNILYFDHVESEVSQSEVFRILHSFQNFTTRDYTVDYMTIVVRFFTDFRNEETT